MNERIYLKHFYQITKEMFCDIARLQEQKIVMQQNWNKYYIALILWLVAIILLLLMFSQYFNS